jgi:hypothetical protein
MAPGATVTIDPHVHSEGSYDAHEPVELLLEQASDIGLDGIVVTDHDTIAESLRAAELAPEYGLIGIPGVEVSTAAGHLLAIGSRSVRSPIDRSRRPSRPSVASAASRSFRTRSSGRATAFAGAESPTATR